MSDPPAAPAEPAATAAPVVLVPSLGRGASDFDALVGALTAAGHPALAVDPPPVDALDRIGAPTLHDLAAHVGHAVASRFGAGHPPVHLVGHALGNRIARCLTADRPAAVATLTLLAAGGLVEPDPDAWAALAGCFDLAAPPAVHLGHVAAAFFAPGNDATVWADGWRPELAARQRAAVEATDRDDWWGATAPRVLVVQGLQDRIAVPANGRRYVADLQAEGIDARLVELDGAGHALLPEQPAAVAAAVVDFLDGR